MSERTRAGQGVGLCSVYMGSCLDMGLLSGLGVSGTFPSAQRQTGLVECVSPFPTLGKHPQQLRALTTSSR